MSPSIDLLLIGVVLFNFFMLGSSRLRALIQCAAAHGFLLGILLIMAHGDLEPRAVALGLVAIALKGIAIPLMLMRALREAGIRREVEPVLSFVSSLVLGAVGTGLALIFAGTLPLAPEHANTLIVPASLATVLTGFLVLTTRRKAITQVVGYLTLENGIFIFGLMLVQAMPFLVEVGVLLDLLVGIFVMGIVIDHINHEFSTIDTDNLTALRD